MYKLDEGVVTGAIRERLICTRLPRRQERLLQQVLERPICYVDNPDYQDEQQVEELLDTYIDVLPGQQLDGDTTNTLSLQSNYARLRAAQLRRQLSQQSEWELDDVLALLAWYQRHLDARAKIVTGNMGLVLGMAKQVNYPWVEFTDLVSEGSMALLRAIDRYDPQRGVKFSSYACRVILRAFARLAQKCYRHRTLLFAQGDEAYESDDSLDTRREAARHDVMDEVSVVFRENLAELSTVEHSVVKMRFSLDGEDEKPQTLAQIGAKLGLTKERIRQIQNKALGKLRVAVQDRIAEG